MAWLAFLIVPAAVLAQQPAFYISCEGTQSGGGGATLYQYELKNITGAPLLLTDLRVGTEDLTIGDYSNIVSPAGFAFTVKLADTYLGTTTVKTPHGQFVPNLTWVQNTAGVIQWSNPAGLLMQPNTTALFGFDNVLPSEDVEWIANAAGGGIGIGLPTVQVAGPLGVFTNGPVHAPVPEPASGAVLLIGAACALFSRRALR